MGLGTLSSAWKTLVKVRQRGAGEFQGKEGNAEAGIRGHGQVAGEGGQVGEGLWPQTQMYHSMTSVCPSLLTPCLPPDTTRPHCLAEPTVWLLPAASVPVSSQAELERPWARWRELISHSSALCHLDPKIIFQVQIVVEDLTYTILGLKMIYVRCVKC